MQRSKTPSAATPVIEYKSMADNFQKSHHLSQAEREEKAR